MAKYSEIPQRVHEYPASDRARGIVRDSMTIDTLFSGCWPGQWSSPAAPEFHDEMDRCIAAGINVLGACPSADGAGVSVPEIVKAAEFYFAKIHERPDRYQLVRTTADIDAAAGGGVCSINMVGAFVDLSNPEIVTTDMLFRHIDHMVDLVGIDHVGFGSDFIPDITWTADVLQSPMGQVVFPDGGYSARMGELGCPTPAPYQIVAALVDTLLEHGYSEEDCGKFLGGNNYRVFEQVWH